jgi:choline dehydrogenase-like flavoprotein
MVQRIEHDAKGAANAVLYIDADGKQHRQRARLVCVAGNAIETARLLLNSGSPLFPEGLANGSGLVGKHFMKHVNSLVFGRFEKPVHMERGPTASGSVYDETRHDTSRGFTGGYVIQTAHVGLPSFATGVKPGSWGADFTHWIENYAHLSGIWLNGEDLPMASNSVTLHPTQKDARGMPIAHIHIDDTPNDQAMRKHFLTQAHAMLDAAGAKEFLDCPQFPVSHMMGTCRMSSRPRDGVVDRFGRSHEVKNLFVSDGSQFVSSGAHNPTLTIVALALRQGKHIAQLLAQRAINH